MLTGRLLRRNHRLSLSPRALAELDGYLKQTYGQPDADDVAAGDQEASTLKVCANRTCETLVFQGWACHHEDCESSSK